MPLASLVPSSRLLKNVIQLCYTIDLILKTAGALGSLSPIHKLQFVIIKMSISAIFSEKKLIFI